MNSEVIFKQVVEILVEEFQVERSQIKLNSKLYCDLGLDSLDLLGLILSLEEKSKKIISIQNLRGVTKIKDIVSLVKMDNLMNQ